MPGKKNQIVVKRVFRYLFGMEYYAIWYQGKPKIEKKIDVHGFVDSDQASEPNRRWSTNKYVFKLFGGVVSWMSRRQSVIALLSIEAKYMSTMHANKDKVQFQRLCSKVGFEKQVVRIDCDSQSTIFLAKNHVYHQKMKHIDVQYHFVRDMVENQKVLPEKVDTLKNVADSLKKSMSTKKISQCRNGMGLVFMLN